MLHLFYINLKCLSNTYVLFRYSHIDYIFEGDRQKLFKCRVYAIPGKNP